MRRTGAGLLAIVTLAVLGCRTTDPVKQALTPRFGRVSAQLSASIGRVEPAAREAATDLGISELAFDPPKGTGAVKPGTDDGTKLDVLLTARGLTADGRAFSLTLLGQSPETTRVAVLIGHWGDEALSRLFLDRVGIRLGLLPPAPIPNPLPSTPSGNPYFARPASIDPSVVRDLSEAGPR